MVAERSSRSGGHAEGLGSRDPADWLTLQQAACELNLSISTVRRMLRDGRLRNRIVPRRGGFAYLVYVPGNRHNAADGLHACGDVTPPPPVSSNGHRVNGNASQAPGAFERRESNPGNRREQEDEIRRLERQVESLSHALSRALKVKQVALPRGVGGEDASLDDPYARYRWLVRRKRWWPF